MADIVERLRDEADPAVNEFVDRLLEEAADEIERLKEEYSDQTALLWTAETKLHAAEDEIGRLHEALEAIDSEILLTGHLKEIVDCALAVRQP